MATAQNGIDAQDGSAVELDSSDSQTTSKSEFKFTDGLTLENL